MSVDDDFGGSVERIGDDGYGGGERLYGGSRESLAEGEVCEDVHEGGIAADFGRRDEAGEDDMVGDAEVAGRLLDLSAEDSIADEQDMGLHRFVVFLLLLLRPVSFEYPPDV